MIGRSSEQTLSLDRDVLLFFEDRDRDTFVRGDRRLRRRLRKAAAFLRPNKQQISGFEMSFILLERALRSAGRTVHVNDFALARRNPHFPIGACGYPHILDNWSLPNPAVLGPGIIDHPKQRPTLMQDPRFRSYLVLCDWMKDLFRQYGDDVLDLWFGGIDLGEWPDLSNRPKDVDVLVYDKIRWNRDTLVPNLRAPLLAELARRGLNYEIVQYGSYTHAQYHKLLARSRWMLFICEHETQGMAYQEALASNVPVLAWDQGYWLDPNRPLFEAEPVKASSVPYFGPECGERFTGVDDFAAALDRFSTGLPHYAPRLWVREHLSLKESADLYLHAYYKAAAHAPLKTATRERELAQIPPVRRQNAPSLRR
jgi:hypothetical protein